MNIFVQGGHHIIYQGLASDVKYKRYRKQNTHKKTCSQIESKVQSRPTRDRTEKLNIIISAF